MKSPTVARVWFGLTALAVIAGVAVQLRASALLIGNVNYPDLPGRLANVFAYFTVQSNVMVGVVCLLLAVRLERTSTVFAVFRLISVVAITVTGVVYHLVLAGQINPQGLALLADQILHSLVPLMAVAGWVVLGPRGLVSKKIVWWTVAFPLAWFAFTLVRGPLVNGWYPYPFINVTEIGYLNAVVNAFVVGLLFLGLAYGASALDRVMRNSGIQSGRASDDTNDLAPADLSTRSGSN